MKCLFCDKELEGKKQYCSDAHRMAYRRRTKAGDLPEQNDPEHQPEHVEGLTRTDALFEHYKPGYYRFSESRDSRKCLHPDCGKEFKTSLALLKFCSPEHMMDVLNGRWINLV